jgi:phage/plasmid-like protein (TIGR03299 family)
MSHAVETMAYANEVPWHGLGNNVDPKVSIEEMLVAAGIDWDVRMHPLFAQVGDGKVAIPNKAALLRETDNKVLTVASPQWKPVQNREVLEFFRDYVQAGGATLETAGSLNGGKTIWGLANLGHGFTVGNGDAVKGYVLLASHHEMGKATTVRLTSVRVVCANTMALAINGAKAAYSQNHLTAFNAEAARQTLGLAHEGMVKLEMNAKALMGLKLSRYDTVRFLAQFFQEGAEAVPVTGSGDYSATVDKLLNDANARSKSLHEVLVSNEKAPGALPGTGWGVLNAVTYWADHVAGRDKSARLNKSWFGSTGDTKLAVERGLLEMAQ